MSETPGKALPMGDGPPLHYRELGTGSPLLLLHGFGCDGHSFDGLADRLKERFRVIIPDQRGHGRSAACAFPDVREATDPLDDLADDAVHLIDHTAGQPVVALGWSMGAAVLFSAVARHGQGRFAGLVVEDMAPRVARGPGWDLGLIGAGSPKETAAVADRMSEDWPQVVERMAPRVFADADTPMAKDLQRSMLDSDPEAMALLWRALATADFRETCSAIDIPVLLTRGAHSRLYPAETMDWLAARMTKAHSRTYSQSGHAPHLEEPARFAADLAAFAERCALGQDTPI
ncbi:alpha/beta fold hydrolase [Fodinicurvata sediminis]|uniref:alpha/beta fold hydrolase n=1 Tax=Fodinicurvata sediminis TaxID=1121832 RepID=UPI0003B3CC3D|nr:alpha/beta hydrolase [Fodinicurvata sediminis]